MPEGKVLWSRGLAVKSLCLALCILTIIRLPALAQSDDEAKLRSITERFFVAYQKKDITSLMTLWSANSPEYATTKVSFEQTFAGIEEIEMKSLSIGKVSSGGDRASVRVVVELKATDAKSAKTATEIRKQNKTLHFVREKDGWKVWRYVSSEEELTASLAAAKSEEDRKKLLEAEKELMTIELQRSLTGKADQLRNQGEYLEATTLYNLALTLAEQMSDREGIANALRGIGVINYNQGNYPQALNYYQKSLKIAEELDNKAVIGRTLYNIGLVHYSQGSYAQAMEDFQRSFRVAEEIDDKPVIGRALNSIGNIHTQQGNYAQALEHCQKSLKLGEELGDKSGISSTLHNIGYIYYQQGSYTQALEYYQKELKLGEEAGDKSGTSSALNSIGNVHFSQSSYAQALEYYRKSLKLREELGDKLGISRTLDDIGLVHYLQGSYTQALAYYQKSLKLKETIGDKAGLARTLNNIGIVHYSQGNYAQALAYYQKSLETYQEVSNISGISSTLNNIGTVHYSQGNYAQALEYYQKSLKVGEELGDKSAIAILLSNIGNVRNSQGSHTQAMEHYQRALKLSEGVGDRDGITLTLINIAEAHLSQDNYTDAVDLANRAASMAKQIQSLGKFWVARNLEGKAYRALGHIDEAKQSFSESIATIEDLRYQIAGDEQQRQFFFEGKLSPYQGMVDVLIEQNKHAEALAFAERAKGRILLDVLGGGRLNITKAMTDEDKHQEQKLLADMFSLNTQIYRETAQQKPDEARLADLNAGLKKARLQYEAFQTSLYAAHPELKVRRGQTRPFSLNESTSLIPDDRTALLEFTVIEDKTFLFVLSRKAGAAPGSIDFNVYRINIKQKDLADITRRFSQLLADRRLAYHDLASRLYDLLIKPARSQLQNITNLIIVPDGALWELPFQALSPSRGRFLIEDHSISYTPSLTVLREMKKQVASDETHSTPSLLAIGNPDFGKETAERINSVLMDERLVPLPEAEKQVRLIGRLYGSQSRVYVGREAMEERVKADAGRYRIMHLATHAILNDASPMYSQIVLAQPQATDGEDGLLEAWEIMKLDLKADLVVLSACETARGRVGEGEGVIGLSWALFVAGCPAAVVSQWKVDSASTTELMMEFHKNLKKKPARGSYNKAEALRQAALKLIRSKQYSHPFYWAAFVVVGNAN